MFIKFCSLYIGISLLCGCAGHKPETGVTEISKWQYGKTGAVSITFDDGIRTQFSKVLPIMERLQLPATFFVITGAIRGSYYPSKFIGRPINDIISETAHTPTDSNNFFKRASAARYLGFKGSLAYYDRADDFYESGKKDKAYRFIDSLYGNVRSGKLKQGTDTSMEIAAEKGLTWDDLSRYTSKGFEIASHTVTHEHLAIMDTANMMYELEKSKQDILEHLGPEYTFSAEVPFGIDDPRVMKAALPVYPALRNLMPEPFMTEINRGDPAQPGAPGKEYVQWQRGPLSKTSLVKMESWVDTILAHDNIWLVLVFHGIDGLGWEPLPHELLDTYFQYIRNNQTKLWVATFADVAKYMRERMNTKAVVNLIADTINITLQNSPDSKIYNVPLTLKTYVPESWKIALIKQGDQAKEIYTEKDDKGTYVLYQVITGDKPVSLSEKP